MVTSHLQLESVIPGYMTDAGRVAVCPSITDAVHAGELTCLIGPNGAGKSTLMRTMAGLQPAFDGVVRLEGADVHRMLPNERARRLAVVLTEAIDVPMLSAYELVAFGRAPFTDWSGRLAPRDHQAVVDALAAVGAGDLASRQVAELSDGERQRVMIARALAQEPSAMILDEITGFLDLPRRIEIMRVLRRVAHDRRCAVLLSTHDLDLALRTADRIWLMAKGSPLQSGMPERLVLDGAFQAAFARDDVSFDDATGSFRVAHPQQWPIVLTGTGPAFFWTERALARHGFYTVPSADSQTARLEIVAGAPPAWQLHLTAGRIEHCRSLEHALEVLRATHDRHVDRVGAVR